MPNFFERHSGTIIPVATIILAFGVLVAINDRRFDAQDEMIGQRFEAQDRLISQRFEAQDRSISQRFEAQDQLFGQRFEAQDKRIDGLQAEMNRRFDHLAGEVSSLRELIIRISARVSRNEGQIDIIREQLQTADNPAP